MIDRLRSATLYGIVDLGYVAADNAARIAREMMRGGVDLLQLRAKNLSPDATAKIARELRPIAHDAGVPLVINDYPEIAREVGAAGVHVGQDDHSLAETRALCGPQCFVGKSTHSLAQATAAAAEGADYIGFGPLFATPTKPDYVPIGLDEIREAHARVALPIFCIGGIKLENMARVIAAGARRVVIVSGLLQAPDVAKYARACKALLHPE